MQGVSCSGFSFISHHRGLNPSLFVCVCVCVCVCSMGGLMLVNTDTLFVSLFQQSQDETVQRPRSKSSQIHPGGTKSPLTSDL